MEKIDIVRHLREIPLFEEISLREFKKSGRFYRLLSLVHERRYAVGEDLFRQGERAHRLFYVVDGEVRLTRVGPDAVTRYLKTLGPGESVGETGLLIGDFHDATAEAMVPTRLLYLEQEEFDEFLKAQPHARRQLNMSEDVRRRLDLPEFDWLRDDELVIFTARRHWANLVKRITPAVVVLLVFLALFLLVGAWGAENGTVARLFSLGLGGVAFLVALYIGWQVINWRDDFFVLTTQRIVHFDRVWPVRRYFEEGSLDNVQDTTIRQKGFAANALNYGDLILQTAGETVDIDLSGVARPVHLKNLIEQELERSRARQVASVRVDIREKLQERLEAGHFPTEETEEDKEEKAAEGAEEAETPESSSSLAAVKSFIENLFPSSDLESADSSIIYWRRFWLPGVFQNWGIVTLLLGWIVGGALLRNILFPGAWPILLIWLLMVGVFFTVLLWRLADWRNDYFKLSPSDIMLVSQQPLLLERTQREARLEDIQNLSSRIPNVMGQIFQYGHVTFETAGTQGRFELKWVRFPERVRSEISQHQQAYKDRQRLKQTRRRQDELLQWFYVYDKFRHSENRQSEAASQPESNVDSDEMD